MTVTMTRRARPQPEPDQARLALLAAMVDQADLELAGEARERAVRALVLTFARHPVGTPHAGLVGAAMRPRTRAAKRAGPRPAAETAVRALIRAGQPAYQRAVEAELERRRQAEVARPARLQRHAERLGPLADRDGARAAQAVVDAWRHTSRAPTPAALARQLGWRPRDAWPRCAVLAEAGWLELHRGRLRPGPRARRVAG